MVHGNSANIFLTVAVVSGGRSLPLEVKMAAPVRGHFFFVISASRGDDSPLIRLRKK